ITKSPVTPIPNEPIGFSAHEYASIAGATPKATTSERLSYSTPNWLEVRDATVESVADERDHNHHGSHFEVAGDCGDHRVEAGEQADRSDRRGQQINAATERAVGFDGRVASLIRVDGHSQARIARAAGIAAHGSISPMMDSPARTRWPADTVTRYSGGKK